MPRVTNESAFINMSHELPLDLISPIAECLLGDSLTLVSLCLINKACFPLVLPFLFKEVRLTNLDSINGFCSVILHSERNLGKYATAVHFEPTNPSDERLHGLVDVVRDGLCEMPNLVNLTIRIDLVTIADIFRRLNSRRPFSLRRLSCSFCNEEILLPFLSTQSTIQYLTVFEPHPFWRPYFIRNPPPDILPNLKSICSNPFTLYTLLPGRPVSEVGSGDSPLSGDKLQQFCQVLETFTTTTEIKSVEVSLPLAEFWASRSDFTTRLARSCGPSLRDLKVNLTGPFAEHTAVSDSSQIPYHQELTHSIRRCSAKALVEFLRNWYCR